MRIVACVLLVDPDGRLLLQLRDGDATHHPNVWGLPGGHGEPGETPEQTAERELLEETGLRADGPLRPVAVQTLPEFLASAEYAALVTGRIAGPAQPAGGRQSA